MEEGLRSTPTELIPTLLFFGAKKKQKMLIRQKLENVFFFFQRADARRCLKWLECTIYRYSFAYRNTWSTHHLFHSLWKIRGWLCHLGLQPLWGSKVSYLASTSLVVTLYGISCINFKRHHKVQWHHPSGETRNVKKQLWKSLLLQEWGRALIMFTSDV